MPLPPGRRVLPRDSLTAGVLAQARKVVWGSVSRGVLAGSQRAARALRARAAGLPVPRHPAPCDQAAICCGFRLAGFSGGPLEVLTRDPAAQQIPWPRLARDPGRDCLAPIAAWPEAGAGCRWRRRSGPALSSGAIAASRRPR